MFSFAQSRIRMSRGNIGHQILQLDIQNENETENVYHFSFHLMPP